MRNSGSGTITATAHNGDDAVAIVGRATPGETGGGSVYPACAEQNGQTC